LKVENDTLPFGEIMPLFIYLSLFILGLIWSIALAFKTHWKWGVTVSFLPIAHIAFFALHFNIKTLAAFSMTWLGLISTIYLG